MDPPADAEVQRRLWLRVIRHYIERRGDVATAITLLRRASGGGERIVNVDTVLPHCDDSILIGGFEAEIRRALGHYHRRIELLKRDMRENTESARAARGEIQMTRTEIPPLWLENKRCDLSGRALKYCRRVFVFPCTHAYDLGVLLADFLGCTEPARGQHVLALALQERIARHDASPQPGDIGSEELELTRIVAHACPQCGVHAVMQRPFGCRLQNSILGSEGAAWEL